MYVIWTRKNGGSVNDWIMHDKKYARMGYAQRIAAQLMNTGLYDCAVVTLATYDFYKSLRRMV